MIKKALLLLILTIVFNSCGGDELDDYCGVLPCDFDLSDFPTVDLTKSEDCPNGTISRSITQHCDKWEADGIDIKKLNVCDEVILNNNGVDEVYYVKIIHNSEACQD